MVQLPDLMAPEGMQQLLPSWQHCKAYLSAFASWTKAYAELLPATAAAGSKKGLDMPGFVFTQLLWLHTEIWQHRKVRPSVRVRFANGLVLVVAVGEGGRTLQAEYAATPSSIELLLLVGLGKVIAVTAQKVVGMAVAASSSSGSNNTIKDRATGPSSSSSNDFVPVVPRQVMLCAMQHMMCDRCAYENLGSFNNINTPPLARTIILGLLHFNCMATWHFNVLPATSAAAAAGKAEGDEGSKKAAQAAPAVDTTAVDTKIADQQAQVPKRLAKLPQQGLPAAVVEQMERISSSWPSEVLVNMQLPCEEAKQKQLLQDLLLLGHVLMVEVPSPVGCNNPGCVNLRGLSEAETAAKACGGCKVARYCSQECQQTHWKVHRPACQRLQQQLKNFEPK
jgi:hypothetical protein